MHVGISKTLLSHLQLVQNAAAGLLTGSCKHEHISPILSALHGLPVHFRIKCLNYGSLFFSVWMDLPHPTFLSCSSVMSSLCIQGLPITWPWMSRKLGSEGICLLRPSLLRCGMGHLWMGLFPPHFKISFKNKKSLLYGFYLNMSCCCLLPSFWFYIFFLIYFLNGYVVRTQSHS